MEKLALVARALEELPHSSLASAGREAVLFLASGISGCIDCKSLGRFWGTRANSSGMGERMLVLMTWEKWESWPCPSCVGVMCAPS